MLGSFAQDNHLGAVSVVAKVNSTTVAGKVVGAALAATGGVHRAEMGAAEGAQKQSLNSRIFMRG